MKAFADGALLRLSLPWTPPVSYDNPRDWACLLAQDVDHAGLHDYFSPGRYELAGDRILFYLHTDRRRNALSKQLRHDKNWLALLRHFPDAKLGWAEDILENRK